VSQIEYARASAEESLLQARLLPQTPRSRISDSQQQPQQAGATPQVAAAVVVAAAAAAAASGRDAASLLSRQGSGFRVYGFGFRVSGLG